MPRNIGPVLEMPAHDGAGLPRRLVHQLLEPMVRICDAIHRYSKIKVVGLCHQIFTGYGMVGYALADKLGIAVPEGRSSKYTPTPTCGRD